jgi:inner membrane protein
MAALLIGANLPDLDVLAIPFGGGLTFRRGWTHGVLATVALPIVLTLALLGWDRLQQRLRGRANARAVRLWPLLLVSFVAVLSHPLLDWLNSYGVRLLMPFSERWFYGDSIFIVDLWLLAMLALGFGLSRRREAIARGKAMGAPRPARVALALAAVYVAANVLLTGVVRRAAAQQMAATENQAAVRFMAGPVPLNPLQRELIYDLGDRYRLGRASWSGRTRISLEPRELLTSLDHPLVQQNVALEPIREYLAWSRFPYVTIDEEPRSAWLHFADARFRTAAGWSMLSVRVPRTSEP